MTVEERQIFYTPTDLYDLVEKLVYKPGWTFSLKDKDRRTSFRGEENI